MSHQELLGGSQGYAAGTAFKSSSQNVSIRAPVTFQCSPAVSTNYITAYRLSPTSNFSNGLLKWYLESHKLPARKRQWEARLLNMGPPFSGGHCEPLAHLVPSSPPLFSLKWKKRLWLLLNTQDTGVKLNIEFFLGSSFICLNSGSAS